jgi:DNA repair exonuclease SbcCD ATPase subunit
MNETTNNYGYYSKVLNMPFDTVEELLKAEETHLAKLREKEEKANKKKADATEVENAFKALNAARKTYKETLTGITEAYAETLKELKEEFEAARDEANQELAKAEEAYSTTLKNFTNKYPEGFHITLKDGDFETTISSNKNQPKTKPRAVYDLFDYLFNM